MKKLAQGLTPQQFLNLGSLNRESETLSLSHSALHRKSAVLSVEMLNVKENCGLLGTPWYY